MTELLYEMKVDGRHRSFALSIPRTQPDGNDGRGQEIDNRGHSHRTGYASSTIA
jgi:hypothetical protein